MKLIHSIPLTDVVIPIQDIQFKYPQFVIVVSEGLLKIYKQVR